VIDESDRRPKALSEAAVVTDTGADPVLQESAKLAEITRQRRREARDEAAAETVFELRDVAVTYGGSYAVQGVDMLIRKNEITALIGPSGCGKTTVLRCLNRTNDLIQGAKVHGNVLYHGIDLYGPKVEPVEVRRRIGMVFQKPNPFPKSIYDNIAFGPRVGGYKGDMDELVERSLRRAALWDEVKRDLKASAMALSGGQQQRLCIARCIAVEPDVILMDEPCSALDPVSTLRIEELMDELVSEYTIVIVTHNMQQAARVSDRTGFFTVAEGQDEKDHRIGILVEFDKTPTVFTNPSDSRTEAYVTGRFG
jgi:phosphate transport system ATP-binding protein